MNKNSSIIKDIFNVMTSNFIVFLSGILNGFMIPVILGPLNYGYYKIFTLYASYAALFHFGFIDGILLDYGGKNYSSLDYKETRSNTLFFILFQFIISILISVVSIFITNYIYKIIIILLSINTFLVNIIAYYQNISQATMKFKELSIVKVIQSILNLITTVILIMIYRFYTIHRIDFYIYILITFFIYSVMLSWYIYQYRYITFGNHVKIKMLLKKFKHYFILGFYLTISYQASTLIFNLDSQFVSIFFNTKTYGIYSFAYTMVSAALSILGAAATVLLPYLQKNSKRDILNHYSTNITYVILGVYFLLIGYFPLKLIIQQFLPEYTSSLTYFRILLPGIVITSCINLINSNYYNALRKSKFYFFITLLSFLLSIIVDSIFYIIFDSPIFIAFSSILSLLIWYSISQYFLIKWYSLKWIKNYIYIIIMMIVFFSVSLIKNWFIGFIFFIIMYIFISFSMFYKFILLNVIKKAYFKIHFY